MEFMFTSWFSQKFEGLRSKLSSSVTSKQIAVKVEETDSSQARLPMSSLPTLLCKRTYESKSSSSSSPLSRKKVKIEHIGEPRNLQQQSLVTPSTQFSEPEIASSPSMNEKELVSNLIVAIEVQNEPDEPEEILMDLVAKELDQSLQHKEHEHEDKINDRNEGKHENISNMTSRFEEKVILRIFNGDLVSNFRLESEKIPCSFYSCEKFNDLRIIEEFQETLTISGKVKEDDAIVFIKGKKENPTSAKRLLVGWISTQAPYKNTLKEFASYLRAKNRCASIRRPDSSIIYLLPLHSVDKEMRDNLDWNPVIAEGQSHLELEPILFFAVYVRNWAKCTPISCVAPEFVGVALK